MTRIRVLLAAFSVSLFLFLPSILRADPITPSSLPDATASGSISIPIGGSGLSYPFTSFDAHASHFIYGLYGSEIFANAGAYGGLDPSVSTNLDLQNITPTAITEGYLTNLGSQSDVSYSFMVNGPDSTLVPIDISAAGGASSAPTPTNGGVLEGGGATAELSIYSADSVLLDDLACAGFIGVGCNGYGGPSFSINDQVFEVLTNQVYTVSLSAETVFPAAQYTPPLYPPPVGTGLLGYDENAYIDPAITLDPSVGSQYSLTFSPGLVSTPEPDYLPILLPCLGGLIFCLGRYRRDSAIVRSA